MTTSEKVHAMTREQRLARLAYIQPIIEDLTKFYNAKVKTAKIYYSWADSSEDVNLRSLAPWEVRQELPELVEFMHTLCTNLCAEKMLLEDIERREK